MKLPTTRALKLPSRAIRQRVQGPGAKEPAEKATWKWAVEIALVVAGVTIAWQTLAVGITQLESVNVGLSSSAAAAVYQQQQDITNLFVEHPEMDPYFSQAVPVTPELDADKASRIKATALQMLYHFEHIRYQVDSGLFEASHDAWGSYISLSFLNSRVLCSTLLEHSHEFDGTGEGTLWADFAAPSCASLGFRH